MGIVLGMGRAGDGHPALSASASDDKFPPPAKVSSLQSSFSLLEISETAISFWFKGSAPLIICVMTSMSATDANSSRLNLGLSNKEAATDGT